jgi:hypothetical protein
MSHSGSAAIPSRFPRQHQAMQVVFRGLHPLPQEGGRRASGGGMQAAPPKAIPLNPPSSRKGEDRQRRRSKDSPPSAGRGSRRRRGGMQAAPPKAIPLIALRARSHSLRPSSRKGEDKRRRRSKIHPLPKEGGRAEGAGGCKRHQKNCPLPFRALAPLHPSPQKGRRQPNPTTAAIRNPARGL